jgi:hypothetical protein
VIDERSLQSEKQCEQIISTLLWIMIDSSDDL